MFCIRKEKIQDLAKAIKGISEEGQIKALIDLPTAERIDFFKKTLNTEEATLLNKELEKAVMSKRLRALGDWVKNNLDEKYRKYELNALGRTFKNLDEVTAFVESKVQGIADKKLGVSLTSDEVKKFTELGKTLYENGVKLGSDFIDLSSKEGLEKAIPFGKAHKELEDFTTSLMPSSAWKSFANRIGRASMLTSIKTPFLNIESNTISGITEAVSRRFSNAKLSSSVEKGAMIEYMKNANKFFKETGIDMTRMISFEDTVIGSGKIAGETLTDGKFLKGYTDFIFNKTLSTPDVAFGSFAFSDSASLNASRIAGNDSKKATEIFKDSLLLNPKTDEGKSVRIQAIADARMATYTNESWSSAFLENLRKTLNKAGGVGDLLMPFVKTPANVAELGADYAGLGFVKAGAKGGKMLYTTLVKKGKVDRDAVRSMVNDAVRSGIGMSLGFAIASQLEPDDFMGAYDPARVKIDQLSNTAYNAVRLHTPFGEKWVSVDYFGALGSTIVGFMYAKKNENSKLSSYISASTSQYLAAMGAGEAMASVSDTLSKIDPNNAPEMAKIFGDEIKRGAADIFISRLVPGVMYDLARATDEVQRDTKQGKFIVKTPLMDINFDQLVNKIAFLRKGLPIKFNALGRTMYEQSPIESMLFGARIKDDKSDAIVEEIYRLRDNGNTPTVKDLRFMNSSNVEELKKKTGDNFYEIARSYGETIARGYDKEMKSQKYKKASDEEKKKILDAIGQDEYVKLLRRNGIKYR